ncbi:MAG: MBL fold metallo-hydrolase [Pyrinomonadaceae bacterium]
MSIVKHAAIRDAAALILLDETGSSVLWAQRNPAMKFLGGNFGFPGGSIEEQDYLTPVENCANAEMAAPLVCAIRETFEEIGVLPVKGAAKLTKGQLQSLNDELQSGRAGFSDILEHWGLKIDFAMFEYAGFWTTPEFSPIRFKTHFFISKCEKKLFPYAATDETTAVEFIKPDEAKAKWTRSEVIIVPPVFFTIDALQKTNDLAKTATLLKKRSKKLNGTTEYIAYNAHIKCVPLLTKTLPPATHTNCFIVGEKKFVVIDAASKDTGEQEKLARIVDKLVVNGGSCKAIIVSHLHLDHIGGEAALQEHFYNKHGQKVPILTHKQTVESLGSSFKADGFLADDEKIELCSFSGNPFQLTILHTPGHARGHLCFYDQSNGFLLSSDNVLSFGTVVISPPEGNMRDYLQSLKRMRALDNLRFMCGSHGTAIYDSRGKIDEYLAHRMQREEQVRTLLEKGIDDVDEITRTIYKNLNKALFPLAQKTVFAHIEKIRLDSKID